jgi:hypothetical protein
VEELTTTYVEKPEYVEQPRVKTVRLAWHFEGCTVNIELIRS